MPAQRFAAILLLLAATATLINSSMFPYESSAAIFLFETSAAVFFIYCICRWPGLTRPLISRRSIPVYIFLLFIFYFVVQGLFSHEGLHARHYLLLGYLLFFIACLQTCNQRVITLLFSGVVMLAAVECIICMLQWWGLAQSKNSFFQVTGSWVNPNVTAMFLAMSSAAAYYLLFQQRGRSKIWVLGLLGGILVSLLLLQCRTALIGAALAAFIICNYRFRWFFHFRKQSLFKKIITGVATMLLITPVCYYAYKAKQRSADGRLLIWKVSTGIIAQKPFNGVGLGMFEHDYNLEQSDYIKKGKAADAEKNNATHVYMAYNEWLETGVEGGIPAMMLLTALFVSLILLYPKEHSSPDREQKRATDSQEESYAKVTAWAGVIAFVSMSMVNFTIQALPAMCVFLLFMAILCSPVLPIKSSLPFVRGLFAKPLIKNATVAVLVMAALYFMYARISVANNLLQVKKASVAVTSGDNASALEILVPLTVQLNNAESYLQLYGKALMNTKKYNEAIIQFNRAKNLVSYPNLYLKIGECYTSLQQYENARSCFLLAHNMEPSRLAPEYAMMQLSVSMKDSTTALAKAKLIINASSKTANARSLFYRQQAFEIIHRLQ